MGQLCEIVAEGFAAQQFNKLCDAEIVFVRKRLVRIARFLCCVQLDAAMQKRKVWNSCMKWIRFLQRTSAASHCHFDIRFAAVLSNLVH